MSLFRAMSVMGLFIAIIACISLAVKKKRIGSLIVFILANCFFYSSNDELASLVAGLFTLVFFIYILIVPSLKKSEKSENYDKTNKENKKPMSITECFEILGVSKNATQEEIKKAYDEKIRIFNENKKTDPLNATTNIKKIQEAFDVLYR